MVYKLIITITSLTTFCLDDLRGLLHTPLNVYTKYSNNTTGGGVTEDRAPYIVISNVVFV